MTAGWTPEDLDEVDRPDEIRVAPDHRDGRPGEFVIIWAVQHDGGFYARSARGPEGAWYRRALASGTGRLRAAGRDIAVSYVDASRDADHAALDAAYHAKYDRYGSPVNSVVGPASHAVTVRITPLD